MNTRLVIRVFWFALILMLPACATGPGARNLSGTYVHRETGGIIVFLPTGEFYYGFTTPTETPPNLGYYRFDSATTSAPHLTLRSAHANLFSLRVAEMGDRVFLTHPRLFTTEQVYERRSDR